MKNHTSMKRYSAKKIADELGPSPTYICALLEVMYAEKGVAVKPLFHDLEEVRDWWLKHPGFRIRHAKSARAKREFGP